MKCDWKWILVLSVVAGCDGDPPSVPHDLPPGTPPTPPPLPGCPAVNAAGVAAIALEWNGLSESFVIPGHTPAELGVDYEVVPLANTSAIHLRYEYDATIVAEPEEVRATCPSKLSLGTAARLAGAAGDIVTIEVVADDLGGHDRVGRVHVAFGSETLTLRTADLGLSGTDWYVVVEPGAGSSRVALAPVAVDRSTAVVSGLPRTAMVVALARIPGLLVQETAVYSAEHISSDWRRASTEWLNAVLVAGPPSGEVRVRRVTPALATAGTYEARTLTATREIILDDATPFVVASAGSGDTDGSVRLGCGRVLQVDSLSFADVTVGSAPDARSVGPGEQLTWTATCVSGETTAAVALHTSSLNGRDALVRLGIEETP